jgi:hypothetical protein
LRQHVLVIDRRGGVESYMDGFWGRGFGGGAGVWLCGEVMWGAIYLSSFVAGLCGENK